MELSELQTSLQTVLTIFLPKVVGVLVLLIVSWIASKWLKTRVSRLVAQRLDDTLAHFFGSLVKYAVLTMALLGCLSIFGFETTSFAALIGCPSPAKVARERKSISGDVAVKPSS